MLMISLCRSPAPNLQISGVKPRLTGTATIAGHGWITQNETCAKGKSGFQRYSRMTTIAQHPLAERSDFYYWHERAQRKIFSPAKIPLSAPNQPTRFAVVVAGVDV